MKNRINNYSKEKTKDLFAEKYELSFLNWIVPEIADFKFYVFSVEEMREALEFNYSFDELLLKQNKSNIFLK